MPIEIQTQVSPQELLDTQKLNLHFAKLINVSVDEIKWIKILKKSIDARQKNIKVNCKALVFLVDEIIIEDNIELPDYPNVENAKPVIIVGAGPAGLFAALQLIELGLKPLVLERGKDVKSRRRDLKSINIAHIVNPESNYCFGEGGAGTYSDGKLYTRSKKRGDIDRILKILVGFGATPEILVEAHPHIGTNKLPKIIEKIRNQIIASGGVVRFNTKVINLLLNNKNLEGVICDNGEKIYANNLILATGHSARDVYEFLNNQNVYIEVKPFALGVRAEHPQYLIDQMQYHCDVRSSFLPPAAYSFVKQVNNRGMYSFCMCPGGIIAPCATAPNEVVTNGWSPSRRDQSTANSGIVVELQLKDFAQFSKFGALAGMEFQKKIEQNACSLAGNSQKVPAQRMIDFSQNKTSDNIPKTSYMPGTTSVEMSEVFPKFLSDILRQGFKEFGKSKPIYFSNEAILHAPESRTSSPVRIPRDAKSLEHLQIKGLYPCGEGAGYAGGIISAAIDGEKCAQQIALKLI